MSVPLRLLGLLLTAVGLVVATTGLVLLVQPLDTGGQAARTDDGDDAAGGPEPDSPTAASRSPLPVSASPGATPSSPPPTSPPPLPGDGATGDDSGSTTTNAGARAPAITTVDHPRAPTPSSGAPAPSSRPPSETPATGPTASPAPSPAASSPPSATGAASDDEDRDEVQGSKESCRHAWPWSGRRGSRGRGDGWGPPVPCDDRAGGAGARGTRPSGTR